jgi:hypothetical protein
MTFDASMREDAAFLTAIEYRKQELNAVSAALRDAAAALAKEQTAISTAAVAAAVSRPEEPESESANETPAPGQYL